jgi:DNA polymerase III delta subunit
LIVLVFEPVGDAAKGTALKSAAKKAGRLIEVKSPDRSVIIKELKKRAGEAGLSFDRDAAEKMCDLVGADLSEAVSELGKLIAACGSTGKVTVDDVNQVVIPSQEYRVFTLLDAVCEGKLGPALTELGRLLSAMPKAEDAAMRNVLPQMHKQLLNIFQARALLDERVSLASQSAKQYLSEAYSLANAREYPQRKAMTFAKTLSLAQVSALLRLVLETDMRLKGQLAQATPEETLERMLAEMCLIVRRQT